MSIFDDILRKNADDRLAEEMLYAEAIREIEQGVRRDGLWGKALADSEGDEKKAKALYLKLRVKTLKDEYKSRAARLKGEYLNSNAVKTLISKLENACLEDIVNATNLVGAKLKNKGNYFNLIMKDGGEHSFFSRTEISEFLRDELQKRF